MSERNKYDERLVAVGNLIREKRLSLGDEYKTRDGFIEDRSINLFDNSQWISNRYLANIELGKNQMSIEKLIQISAALEEDPVDLFKEIVYIYRTI